MWNWGDGTPEESSPSPFASHTYQQGPATRTITLTVSDNQGATARSSAQVKVEQAKQVQSVIGTVKILSTKSSGFVTVQFNISRSKSNSGYQGTISFRDDGAGISGQATLKPADPVSPCAPNGATGTTSGTASWGRRGGKINLTWQAFDLSSIGQGADKVTLSAMGDLTYKNAGSAISGDMKVKY
jgi:hypothetical protein